MLSVAGQAHAQVPADQPPPVQPAPVQPAPPPTDPNAGVTPVDGSSTVQLPPPPSEQLRENDPLQAKIADMIRKEMGAVPKLLEFHGYLRAGISQNDKGGDADAFQAPGAYSKFRLGNEVETYGEIGLDSNWINPDHNDTWFKTSVKLAVVAPRDSTFDTLNAIAIREAYAQAGHVIPSEPEMTFWAGQRFYRRRDSHIIDFFYQDMSGYGAGFEDLKVGEKAKIAVAYLGGSREYNMGDPMSDVGRLYKSTIDLRLYDVPAGKGSLEFWLIPSVGTSGSLGDAANNHNGMGGGVFYFLPMLGGFNELSAEYGYAGSADFSTSADPTPSDGWMFRVVDRAVLQLTPNMSMMASGVFQLDNRDGNPTGTTDSSAGNMWVSVGARPVYNFTKYTGIAVEGGVDIVKPETEGSSTGVLGKLTIAPLIRPGMDFWARPELRAFVTMATWSNSIKGQVGGAAFANDTFGLTAGVQMESWW
ncbi:MAG TPA: carbohydrate porin [Kofleriaceae bacterium]|nr:carbohydrate porin [Kofleriaceae bacterium]